MAFSPISPCKPCEVTVISLKSLKDVNLKDDFIPIVEPDKTDPAKGFGYGNSSQGFLYNLTDAGIPDRIYYDDISGYDGKDIGHKSHRKGEDIDIRYPGTPTSKRFWYESAYYNTIEKDDKILVTKSEQILNVAVNWKFTKNHVYKAGIKNAGHASGHEHHFHMGHRE